MKVCRFWVKSTMRWWKNCPQPTGSRLRIMWSCLWTFKKTDICGNSLFPVHILLFIHFVSEMSTAVQRANITRNTSELSRRKATQDRESSMCSHYPGGRPMWVLEGHLTVWEQNCVHTEGKRESCWQLKAVLRLVKLQAPYLSTWKDEESHS